MRAFTQWLALAPLLVFAGCSTLQQTPRLASSGSALALSEADANLGEALAHYSQGLIAEVSLGQSTSAINHFRQAAILDPSHIPLNLKVAADYIGRKDYTGAVSVLKSLERTHPDSVEIRLLLGSVYQAQGNQSAAIQSFRAVIQLAPERPDGYIRLATLYVLELESRRAMAVLKEGFRAVTPPDPLVEFCESAGRLFAAGKDVEGAILFFEKVSEYQPDDPQVAFWLGELYEMKGARKKALVAYARACKSDSNEFPAAFRKANLEMQTDPALALTTLRNAIKRFPDDLHLRVYLALLYVQLDQYPEALTQFDDVARRMPKDEAGARSVHPLFYFWYGSACERAGRWEDAERYLARYIAANPTAAEALNYLAYMWAERGVNLEQAAAYTSVALVQEPDNGAYLDTLGWIQYQRGDYAAALTSLERALSLVGDDPAILSHLGDVCLALNQPRQAKRWWQKSLKLAPENKAVREKLLKVGGLSSN